MLVLMCESCQIRVSAYDAWVEHVLSDQHQSSTIIKKLMQSKNVEEVHGKGLLAVLSDGTLTASMVAWHVSNFGLLCDLYYGHNQKYVIFHLDSLDCNEAAKAGTTAIDNNPVLIEWVSAIPIPDWERLFGPMRRPHLPKVFESKISLPPQYFGFIETIFHQETLSQEERMRRHVAINDIASVIQTEYNQATFHPYGSYVTNLGNAHSSLNLFIGNLQIVVPSGVEYGGMSLNRNNTVVTRVTVEDIYRYLASLPPAKKNICNGVQIITTPDRQQFITFMHRPTNLWGSIYIRNPLLVQRSKLIAFYMTLDERVRPFLQLVRYWGRFHGLTAVMPGVGKPMVMRNYTLMLLGIVFLENVQIIPTVQALQLIQKDERELCPVGPWEGSFCEDKEQVLAYMEMNRDPAAAPKSQDPNEPLTNKIVNLAHEFFNRTALLEPNSLVVCSLLGRCKPKYQFYGESLDQLPEGMERYKTALTSGAFRPICYAVKNKGDKQLLSMVVQDPFELTLNVTEHLSSDFLVKFRIICSTTALAFQKLITGPGQRNNNNLGMAVKDLFTPVPAVEINHAKMKSVIGELMCIRRDSNQKQPRQERSNGFAPDTNTEKQVPIYQKNANVPNANPKYDGYCTTKPKPLMSINTYTNNTIPGNYVPPLIPPVNQSTSYPPPLLTTDFVRREGQQIPPPLIDFRSMKKNFQPTVAPLTAPEPIAPPEPIVLGNKDSVIKISLDPLFETIFNESFGHLQNFADPDLLVTKKNTLWLLCFSELILSVWHKCFKLNDVLIKDNESPKFVKHIFPKEIFELMDLKAVNADGPLAKKRRNGEPEDGEVHDVNIDKLWEKINKIPAYPNVFETTFECFVRKPFFNGRQEIARWMSGKDPRNPLDREEDITKKVLVRCIAGDLTTNITIHCSVAADMGKTDEQIQLFINEEFDQAKLSIEDTFFQRFFSSLVPQYAIYRLCQLLEIPNQW